METNQLLLIGLLFLAGLANGLMDSLAYHFTKDNFLYRFKSNWFGNPADTWENKYKNYPESTEPKYWGAKTFLSFTTDAWHFFKFIQLQSYKLIVTLSMPYKITSIFIVDFLIIYVAAGFIIAAGFHFTYTFLKKL